MKKRTELTAEKPRTIALSTYEKIIQEGRQQGIQQECEASTKRFVLSLIRETDLSDERIAELMGVNVTYVTELRQAAGETIS